MLLAMHDQEIVTLEDVSACMMSTLRDFGCNLRLTNALRVAIRQFPGHDKFLFEEDGDPGSRAQGACQACWSRIASQVVVGSHSKKGGPTQAVFKPISGAALKAAIVPHCVWVSVHCDSRPARISTSIVNCGSPTIARLTMCLELMCHGSLTSVVQVLAQHWGAAKPLQETDMSRIVALCLSFSLVDVGAFFHPFDKLAICEKIASLWPVQTARQGINWEKRFHNFRKNWLTGRYVKSPYCNHPEWDQLFESAHATGPVAELIRQVPRVDPDKFLHAYFPSEYKHLIKDIMGQCGTAWLLGTPRAQLMSQRMPGFESMAGSTARTDERTADEVQREVEEHLSVERAAVAAVAARSKQAEELAGAPGAWEYAFGLTEELASSSTVWFPSTRTLKAFCAGKHVAPLAFVRRAIHISNHAAVVCTKTGEGFYRFRAKAICASALQAENYHAGPAGSPVGEEPSARLTDGVEGEPHASPDDHDPSLFVDEDSDAIMQEQIGTPGMYQGVEEPSVGTEGSERAPGLRAEPLASPEMVVLPWPACLELPSGYEYVRVASAEECTADGARWVLSVVDLKYFCRKEHISPLPVVRKLLKGGDDKSTRPGGKLFFRFRARALSPASSELQATHPEQCQTGVAATRGYVIRAIKESRSCTLSGATEYLVSWDGYSSNEDSWIPHDNMKGCQEMLEEYESHNVATSDYEQRIAANKRRNAAVLAQILPEGARGIMEAHATPSRGKHKAGDLPGQPRSKVPNQGEPTWTPRPRTSRGSKTPFQIGDHVRAIFQYNTGNRTRFDAIIVGMNNGTFDLEYPDEPETECGVLEQHMWPQDFNRFQNA